MSTLRLLLAATAGLALAVPVAADVLRVPADYGLIQDAVLAASDGDVVLVAAGSYDPEVAIVGKGITLIADGGRVALERLLVDGVPPGGMTLIRGFDADASTATGGHGDALFVVGCAGIVRVEDCTFVGRGGWVGYWPGGIPSTDGSAGVRVQDCTGPVALLRCTATGGNGDDLWEEDTDWAATDGGPGLHVRNSVVYVTGSTLVGGDGGSNYDTVWYDGGAGGAGVANKATVHVEGTVLVGGEGGDADCTYYECGNGGPGGHGVFQDAVGAVVTTRANVYLPGQGGLDGDWQGSGPDGVGLAIWAGTHWGFGETYRSFTATSPVREGGSVQLAFTGQPGDTVFLWLGFLPMHKLMFARQGVFLVAPPFVADGLLLGTLSLPGTLTVPLPVPELGPGFEGGTVLLQAAFGNGLTVLVGPHTTSTLLDSSF